MLVKLSTENVTEYIIRAENAATALRDADKVVSDSLLISMVLKGLPVNFKSFIAVITQSEKQFTFIEFKTNLQDYEDTEEATTLKEKGLSVMKMKYKYLRPTATVFAVKGNIVCYSCGTPGHKSSQCITNKGKSKMWCSFCKNNSHTDSCRKQT